MKLQVAIDRVSLEKALNIIKEVELYADIIEIGTSLIKDYGMESVRRIKEEFPEKTILTDIKTIDQAEYEFNAAYKAGADIATVMGMAPIETIEICQRIAKQYHKDYMIDLLEIEQKKLDRIKSFSDAIFCIHLPSDNKNKDISLLIKSILPNFDSLSRIAVAGGVNASILNKIKNLPIEIAVVGSAITKTNNISKAAKEIKSILGGP